jgi:copper chaperone CopZ
MNTKTVSVPNIGCDGCVRTIQNEIKDVAGVVEVKADLKTKLVSVKWDDKTSWQIIAGKLAEIDYPAVELANPA